MIAASERQDRERSFDHIAATVEEVLKRKKR
jgi:hypothetical protein